MICPIGLECLAELCPNRDYCNHLAAPWPLPFQIWEVDYLYEKGDLIVSIPEFINWEEVPNNDHAIDEAAHYDDWVRHIRRELREAGWANPDDLPYYWDKVERALIVDSVYILNLEAKFQDQTGFAPAVRNDNWRSNWLGQRQELRQDLPSPEVDRWGYYLPNGIPGLAWKWQEDEDNED